MNKTIFLFLCFYFIITFQLKAQHRYLDNNPVWIVHEYDPQQMMTCPISSGTLWYYLKGDTVLGGYTYHKVFCKELYEVWCPPAAPYYFGSSDTVHPCTYLRDTLKQIRQWWLGVDSVLYDFNLSIGDSIFPFANEGYHCGYKITAIDSVPVSNYYRKRFTYSSTSLSTGPYYLIEGIGWTVGFLETIQDYCPNVSTDLYYNLTCYGVNDTAWYPSYSAVSPCVVPDFTLSVKELTITNEITISPNPFTSQTTITFSEEQKNTIIKITDVLGNVIRNYELGITNSKTFTIDMTGVSKGIYIVNVQTAKGVENRKVVVQ